MGKSNKEEVVCFIIDNYEERYDADLDVITKLERALASGGANPAKIDFPSKLCCVTITDKTVTAQDVLAIIEQLGFRARLIEEKP